MVYIKKITPYFLHSTSLAVELTYGAVYCFKCRDYIYDSSLDEISRTVEQHLAQNRFMTSRQPMTYVAWEPTKDEIELLKQNPQRKRVESGSTIGMCVRFGNFGCREVF